MTQTKPIDKLAMYLAEGTITKCTGKSISKVYDDKPSKIFFIGTLNPVNENAPPIYSKMAPYHIGISALVDIDDFQSAILNIKITGSYYHKIFPTYDEQLETSKRKLTPLSIEEEELENEGQEDEELLQETEIRDVYEKLEPFEVLVQLKLSEILNSDYTREYEIPEIKAVVEQQKVIAKSNRNGFSQLRQRDKQVTPEMMESKEKFSQRIDELRGEPLIQGWDLSGKITSKPYKGKIKLTLTLDNVVTQEKEPKDIDNSFFESHMEMEIEGSEFKPYVLDYLANDYKFDGNIEADGINCSGVKVSPNRIVSEHVPIFKQKRFKSNDQIQIDFKMLVDDPIGGLIKLKDEMKQYRDELKAYYDEMESEFNEKQLAVLKQDINRYETCLERFSYGIQTLSLDTALGKAINEAFRLMNESFLLSSKGFESWRVFQIVFITSLVPDIVCVYDDSIKNFRDHVDLIYFPTGGGKTEAYLGIVVMQMFFDRLMGKMDGVTAITRFPLRLLSLQQLQRIADIFAKAELVRRKHDIISGEGYEPFSTGYFVGSDNTPNKLKGYGVDVVKSIKDGDIERDKYRIISKCPFCQQKDSVSIEVDEVKIRIYHVCNNTDCSESILPIYISDYEVYRYMPTFIVGTVDKTATCARQRYYRHLFGQVSKKCPDHGYFSGGRCLQHESCNRDPDEYLDVDLKDPTPSIMIQDELHLIRESLGSYSSHYETYFDEYMKRITDGKKRLKIIGATATIQQFEHQVRHLYNRPGILFPPPSPNLKKSIFAYEDENDLARLIIGVMPHNKTIIFAVLDLLRHYYEMIKKLEQNPERLLEEDIGFSNKDEALVALTNYKLLLSYNLVKLEGDAITQSIKTMVNPRLREVGIKEMAVRTMTGDVTFSDVRDVLKIVEDKESTEDLDMITATSMISHGVDIDVLNFMVFRGMPRNTAEYIQAYSRVGRKVPGIVFIVFNHTRERDQSYYKYFNKFHEFQTLLVEPVPINRWAKFSINRTLPGILCAYLLNYHGFKAISYKLPAVYDMHMAGLFSKAFSNRMITDEDLKQMMHDSYGTESTDLAHHFKSFIDNKVDQYTSEILDKKDAEPLKAFIPNTLSDIPMMSLRDTDIPVDITPTGESFEPMKRVGSKRTRGGD